MSINHTLSLNFAMLIAALTTFRLVSLFNFIVKSRFIAKSSFCTTTELSKLLTSCLTAIKSHDIRYCETV